MPEIRGTEGRVGPLALSVGHGAWTGNVSGGGVGEVGAGVVRHEPIVYRACGRRWRLREVVF